MTFPPLRPTNDVHRFGCDASISGDASPDGLSCGSAASDVPSQCHDPGLLGASSTRSHIDPRRGVLVAHTTLVGPGRGEVCLLPFRVSPVTSRVAWDPSQIVQIGGPDAPSPAQAWRELSPLEDSLEGCRVHIDRASSLRSPLVRERLRDVDLVVGVDESSVHVIARLPIPEEADVAILADDVPWREMYGRELAPLDAGWWTCAEGGVQSTLRLAALMGYVLELGAPSDGMRPIEYLLSTFEAPEPLHRDWPHEALSHVRV